jgi:hypothetical protein
MQMPWMGSGGRSVAKRRLDVHSFAEALVSGDRTAFVLDRRRSTLDKIKKALHARTCVFPKVAINTAWSNKQTERPSAWMKVSAVATKSQGYVRVLVAASKARAKRCVLATHWNVLHAALELTHSLTHQS